MSPWFKWGLTKSLRIVAKQDLDKTCWKFRIKPIALLTLAMFNLVYMSNFNLESNAMP